ncbi:MAG: hypothetical protein Kow0062_01040 [Acidobacteriota bacterium]
MARALAVMLLLAGAFAAPAANATVVVRLPAERDVPAARRIVLGDATEIEGPLAEELASLELCPPLDPGRERVFARTQIARLVGRSYPGVAVEWAGAETVRLRATGVPLDTERVAGPLLAAVRAHVPEGRRVALRDLVVPRGVLVPDGQVEVRFDRVAGPATGTTTFRATLVGPRGWTRTIPVRARLELSGPMLVATRDLRPGETVAAGDVVVREGVLPARRRVFAAPAEVVGLRLRAFVRAGRPVTRRDVDRPDAVEPGQPVVARLRRGSVVLTLDTVARSRGDVGDIVRVRGLGGRGLLEARVLAPGLVEIVGSRKESRR